jgi:hypothetical protein
MLLLILAAFFLWLGLREIYYGFVTHPSFQNPHQISKPYVFITLLIAAALAYSPIRFWNFERFLTAKAKILSESRAATVHCNTVFDTFFDSQVFAAGHAQIETGRIVLQHPWCGALMDFLQKPDVKNRKGIIALHIFTHEAMHIRGERDEAKTECQAIQRFVRAAKLLGVKSEAIAQQSGRSYYENEYQQRATHGAMSNHYYSKECAPGKALDEQLPDSTWN